jgi:predicted O-methyltransferase YrrM
VQDILNKIMKFGYGGMSVAELSFLMKICEDKVVLELGSMVGQSSYAIASVAKSLDCVDVWEDNQDHLEHDKKQAEIYAKYVPDLPNMYRSFCENCKEFISSGKIKTHRGNTNSKHADFKNKQFDIILIDADHSWKGVSTDFSNYESKLKDNGVFLFHDYGDSMWVDIKRFCNKMEEEKRIRKIDQVERIAAFEKIL